jgi:hypothetical protein
MSRRANVEMYGNSRSPEIIHPKDRAYDIPPHLVEDQDLPYGAVRGGLGGVMVGVVLGVDVGDGSVEVQYTLDTG